MSNYVNNRIEELNSCVIEEKEKHLSIIGFTSPERLLDFYDKGIKCFFSTGFYKYEDYKVSLAPSNGLLIEIKNGIEVARYAFQDLLTTTIKYKIGKQYFYKTIKIRMEKYHTFYNLIDAENNLVFETREDLEHYISNTFNIKWLLNK